MQWLKTWWARCRRALTLPPWRGPGSRHRHPGDRLNERQQAQALIAAIDRGGLPLNPARVNHIARSLGLEVSSQARMEHTITRIRQALERGGH